MKLQLLARLNDKNGMQIIYSSDEKRRNDLRPDGENDSRAEICEQVT